jgi:hypothetical protein
MDIDKPNNSGFTIYSKSGCPNCLKSKALLSRIIMRSFIQLKILDLHHFHLHVLRLLWFLHFAQANLDLLHL